MCQNSAGNDAGQRSNCNCKSLGSQIVYSKATKHVSLHETWRFLTRDEQTLLSPDSAVGTHASQPWLPSQSEALSNKIMFKDCFIPVGSAICSSTAHEVQRPRSRKGLQL